MNRRAQLIGIAAVVAAAGGIGVRLWRSPHRDADNGLAEPLDLWSLTFQDIDGNAMPMAPLRGRPLLLNFWATWCGPCIVEMPLLDRFAREHAPASWHVIALAIDQPDPVRRFIAERTLRLPVAMAGSIGLDLSRQLGNGNGGLPFTAAFDSTGRQAGQHLGAVDTALLGDWLHSVR